MDKLATRTAEHCFVPLTVGGGLRTTDDVRALLLAGADKVTFKGSSLAIVLEPMPHQWLAAVARL